MGPTVTWTSHHRRTAPAPTTLYAAGRFMHADDPRAPPLYELLHSVGFLGDTDRVVRVVRVERLDHSVRQLGGATSTT